MSRLSITIEGHTFEVDLSLTPEKSEEIVGEVNGVPVRLVIPNPESEAQGLDWVFVDERRYKVVIDSEWDWIQSPSGMHAMEIQDLDAAIVYSPVGNGRIKAPIPGQVTRIMVALGDEVETGQPLLVLEAMKMENEIRATRAGKVKTINIAAGQRVAFHELLMEIE